jgi:NDP-sugar pyrophosphorylase family protein
MYKKAIILAGGLGTRLHPYTIVLPKPLMPVGDLPILEIVVRQLAKYNFESITMAVNHQAEIIKAFFGDGSKWKIAIDYSIEDEPLSTMGPLKIIQDLPENFLIHINFNNKFANTLSTLGSKILLY